MKNIPNNCLTFSIRQKKKVNSYNGLQTKFSDCAFKTKKKKISSALQTNKQTTEQKKKKHNRQDQTELV